MKKIGLLGGTFNPVHRCHLVIAAQVRDRLHLDRILFIPTGDPPHKSAVSLAPASHRLEMVRLAVQDDATFDVSDIEAKRPTKSFSIDTVRLLQKQHPDDGLFFIVGLDAFLDFPAWREAPELLKLCHFVVVSRPGRSFRSLLSVTLLPAVPGATLAELDAGPRSLLTVDVPGGRSLSLLRLPPCDASASDIRRRLRAQGSLSNLLPAPVESYIIRNRLYQEGTDHPGV